MGSPEGEGVVVDSKGGVGDTRGVGVIKIGVMVGVTEGLLVLAPTLGEKVTEVVCVEAAPPPAAPLLGVGERRGEGEAQLDGVALWQGLGTPPLGVAKGGEGEEDRVGREEALTVLPPPPPPMLGVGWRGEREALIEGVGLKDRVADPDSEGEAEEVWEAEGVTEGEVEGEGDTEMLRLREAWEDREVVTL